MFNFKITSRDQKARVGEFTTPHGTLETPVFMPVGTHGAVKGVSAQELQKVGSEIILGNTYHLYLRPGDELVRDVGGIHNFMGWQKPILTDSGGFQVFSLGERGMNGNTKNPLRRVAEEGITFKSHLDGSRHLFTPEKSIQIQQNLGADIIMAFDQPVYGMSTESLAGEAMRRSMRWLERSKNEWLGKDSEAQALFGIVQGGTYTKLHTESAKFVAQLDLPGNALGGLSVGEEKTAMWEAVESIVQHLPEDKPRYFMGLGDPYDCIEAIIRGIDMFDCVAPTRIARHGAVWQVVGSEESVSAFWAGNTEEFLRHGKEVKFERWNLKQQKFQRNASVLRGSEITSIGEMSQATLHHYIKIGEMLGFRVLSEVNIALLHIIVAHTKKATQMGVLNDFLRVIG